MEGLEAGYHAKRPVALGRPYLSTQQSHLTENFGQQFQDSPKDDKPKSLRVHLIIRAVQASVPLSWPPVSLSLSPYCTAVWLMANKIAQCKLVMVVIPLYLVGSMFAKGQCQSPSGVDLTDHGIGIFSIAMVIGLIALGPFIQSSCGFRDWLGRGDAYHTAKESWCCWLFPLVGEFTMIAADLVGLYVSFHWPLAGEKKPKKPRPRYHSVHFVPVKFPFLLSCSLGCVLYPEALPTQAH